MERIDLAHRQARERLTLEQEKLDRRFDRLRDRMSRKYGDPSDAQQRIIEESLNLLREDGLANITLRKLADRVNMRAPALYWYFKSKEELVDFMAEAILQKEFKKLEPKNSSETWQEWLTSHMEHLRRAMLRYSDGARVVAGAHLYPAVSLGDLLEAGIVSLHAEGVDLKRARRIVWTAVTFTFGYVIEEQAAPTSAELAELDLGVFLQSYPNIAQSIGDEDRSEEARNVGYREGLDFIITGASQ